MEKQGNKCAGVTKESNRQGTGQQAVPRNQGPRRDCHRGIGFCCALRSAG